jgi:hypothetical protein
MTSLLIVPPVDGSVEARVTYADTGWTSMHLGTGGSPSKVHRCFYSANCAQRSVACANALCSIAPLGPF